MRSHALDQFGQRGNTVELNAPRLALAHPAVRTVGVDLARPQRDAFGKDAAALLEQGYLGHSAPPIVARALVVALQPSFAGDPDIALFDSENVALG